MTTAKKADNKFSKTMSKKKKILMGLVCSLFVVLATAVLYLFVYEPAYKGPISYQGRPLVFAHRGFGNLGPDNSLAASEKAVQAGITGVDVDGQLTKDGKIVIFHDLSLDRLTESKGKVADYTLDELKQLDLAKKYKGEGYVQAPVMSFEDFVKTITPHGILMVELKVASKRDTGIEKEALRIIKEQNAFDKVYLSSFNPLVIHRLESLDRRINTVYIFMDTNWNKELLAEMKPEDVVDLPWIVRQEWIRRGARKLIKPDMLSVNIEVAKSTREGLIKKGWPVLLWAPNDEVAIRDALGQKPYGIISDEPIKTNEILEATTR